MTDTALDIEQPDMLLAYLRGTGRIGLDETVEVRPLSGGVSNRTVLVRRSEERDWVVKQALPRLRVASEWLSDPRRIHREAAGLRCLSRIVPDAVTPLVFEDEENRLFAMEAVPQPHDNWKALLLAGGVDLHHVEQFARILAAIHHYGCGHRASLAEEFADTSFFESLRLEPYYGYSGREVPEAEPFLSRLAKECRVTRWTLVHGDYSPKNILIRGGRMVLLDHEVIHFGDGAFDIGFAMTHLLSKAHHLAGRRRQFQQAARRFWEAYCETGGDQRGAEDFEPRAVRHTLGCLLARVAGRSPLEYLAPAQRDRQRKVVLELMSRPPAWMPELVDQFVEGL